MKAFLARYPQYTNMCDKSNGACPLHYVAFSSQCLGQAEVMRTLLEAGAKPMVAIHHHAMMGSVLSTACATYDQDPAFLKMLLENGADATKQEKMPGAIKFMRRLAGVFQALGNVQMRGFRIILNQHPGREGLTPAHLAGRRGDIATVQLLAQHAQFNTHALKDAKGRTPIDTCAPPAPFPPPHLSHCRSPRAGPTAFCMRLAAAVDHPAVNCLTARSLRAAQVRGRHRALPRGVAAHAEGSGRRRAEHCRRRPARKGLCGQGLAQRAAGGAVRHGRCGGVQVK